jgi:hypothetical protein
MVCENPRPFVTGVSCESERVRVMDRSPLGIRSEPDNQLAFSLAGAPSVALAGESRDSTEAVRAQRPPAACSERHHGSYVAKAHRGRPVAGTPPR